jgi:hypothetical protein
MTMQSVGLNRRKKLLVVGSITLGVVIFMMAVPVLQVADGWYTPVYPKPVIPQPCGAPVCPVGTIFHIPIPQTESVLYHFFGYGGMAYQGRYSFCWDYLCSDLQYAVH